jgi:hypothetical protein
MLRVCHDGGTPTGKIALLIVQALVGLTFVQGPAAPLVAMDARQHLVEEGVEYEDCKGFTELSRLMKMGK